ncbi:MAG: PAS domain S-box protein [Spirochaetales bacterium]|nr:PAS domain S-box protein [Spirochaetales bacterium]
MNKQRTLRFGIGTKILIGFLILSVLPILIGGSVNYAITRNQLETSTKRHLQDLARDCGRKISLYMSTQYDVTRLVSHSDILIDGNREAMQKYIESVKESYPGFAAVSVIDPDGIIIACTQAELIGESRADRGWYQETVKSKGAGIIPLDAYRAETAGWDMVIGLNTPIIDEISKELIGVLTTRVRMDFIMERIKTIDTGTGYSNHTFLLNGKGETIAGPDKSEFLELNHFLALPAITDLLSGKTEIADNIECFGKKLVSVSFSLRGSGAFDGWGWKIIVIEDVDSAYETAYIIRKQTIILMLVIAFLVSAFAVLLSGRFSRPLKEVSESALQIVNGYINPVKIEYSAKDEIGDLVCAFNTMNEHLHTTTVTRNSLSKEINERILAEKALWESEEKFRILSEQSLLSIMILQNGLVKYANQAFSDLVGYSIEEIRNWGKDEFLKTIHSEDKPFAMDQAEKKQEGSGDIVDHYQFRVITQSRETKWVEIYSKTIIFKGKKADMATFIDISEKIKTEEESVIQQQMLMQTEKLASLGVLVAGVAHEINNPNHAIMASAGLVSDSWKSITSILEDYYQENGDFLMGGINYTEMKDEIPDYLQAIINESKRIDTIVRDLKNFARQEKYEMQNNVNMKNVINSSVKLISNYIMWATKNFTVELGEEIPLIKGNFQKLEQVMINLIENACQSLTDKMNHFFIGLQYKKPEHCIVVKIVDEGAGIAPSDLPSITDPFFTTKRLSGGTGLGLSICASIIEDHNGTLNIESEVGEGTTVTITLPVKNNNGTEDAG